MYISFIYQDVQYCGLAIKIINERIQPYLFYIDTNLFQRITKVRHLKKIKNVKDQEISQGDLVKLLKSVDYNGKLFDFEGSQFTNIIKKGINKQLEYLRNQRENHDDFDLKNFDNKLKFE